MEHAIYRKWQLNALTVKLLHIPQATVQSKNEENDRDSREGVGRGKGRFEVEKVRFLM